MAKLGFKDIIMKYLKKDEAFKVKYAMNPNQKIAVATYNDRADAEKFVSDIIKKGGKAILTQEDAPANATGTAVAGTGDDSSTVVVKKKKDQQKKLMTRMGITEAINKAIPDLEYPKDEIRERVNQLKTSALGEAFTSQQIRQAYGIANDPRYKGGNYDGAVKAIEKIAKGLSKHPDVANVLKRTNEEFKLKFTDPANKKKFHIIYRSKGEAQAKMAQLKRDGVKEIEIVREQLEELFGISSNANHRSKTIKMLDTMNIKYEKSGLNGLVIKGVPKNKQQDLLDKIKKDVGPFTTSTKEDLDAQPQDKDVKKIKGTQPKKYYKKMSPPEKEKRAKFFRKQKYKKSDDDDDYKAAPGDEKAKTKKSIHTKKFDKMYGSKKELYSYGYPSMYMKPVAKLNPLRRKDESK